MVTDRVNMARLQAARERVDRAWKSTEYSNIVPWNVWERERKDEAEQAPHIGYLAGTGQWIGPSWSQSQATDLVDGANGPSNHPDGLKDLWNAWQEDTLEDDMNKEEQEFEDELTSGRAAPHEMRKTISQSGSVLRIGTPIEMAISGHKQIPPKRVRKHRWGAGGQRLGSKDPMEMEGVMRRGFLLDQFSNKPPETLRVGDGVAPVRKGNTTSKVSVAPQRVIPHKNLNAIDAFKANDAHDDDVDVMLKNRNVDFDQLWEQAQNETGDRYKLASGMKVLYEEEHPDFFGENLGIGMEIVGSDVSTGSSEVDVLKV